MKKEFDFKFLNITMYIAVAIIVFFTLQYTGVLSKLLEVSSALVPVCIGLFICFVSLPIANKLKKMGVSPKYSAVISLAIIYAIIIILFATIIPMFVQEITKFISDFPSIYTNAITGINNFIQNTLGIDKTISYELDINNIEFMKKYMDNILDYSITTLQSIFSFIISVIATIVVSFFLVKDMEDLKKKFINYISNNGLNKKRYNMINEIDVTLISYIKGIVLDSFIVGVLTTIVCLVLKLDYAIVFGVLIFVLNFVPYIGALISEIVIAIYALTVGGPVFAIVTLILLIAIQILDANVLQPNIIGKSVDLHPVIVFAGLIVGNLLMGIVGMIIVVPVLAIIRIMFKYKFSKDSLK
ncbi:MAG: AI-2E family transporter [Clostridia bacterium]